jgi:hypothetical protein
MSEPFYRLLDGVHRSVAAHLAGLSEIKGQVDIDGSGNLSEPFMIPLSEIYSPKTEIDRFDRRKDLLGLVQLMLNETDRERLPAVIVMVLPATRAKYFVRVADVVVHSL